MRFEVVVAFNVHISDLTKKLLGHVQI